ncbi:MAG: deoxycytidylate deaminase [bacterium]|nr:deoxycytidylate deaminase [bacterium]
MLENPPRLSFEESGILAAFSASSRSTCPRAHVGCALFSKNKVIKGTGYNGARAGAPQCDQVGCLIINGHCMSASHAEDNAILFSRNSDITDGYSFVTIRPCRRCFDLHSAVGIKHVYYLDEYRSELDKDYIEDVCQKNGIELKRLDIDIIAVMQKALTFHQGPGGLLIAKNKLKIEESPNE